MQEFQLRAVAFWEETAYVRYPRLRDLKKTMHSFASIYLIVVHFPVVLTESAFLPRNISLIGKREHVIRSVTLQRLHYVFFFPLFSHSRITFLLSPLILTFNPFFIKLKPVSLSCSQWTRPHLSLSLALIVSFAQSTSLLSPRYLFSLINCKSWWE